MIGSLSTIFVLFNWLSILILLVICSKKEKTKKDKAPTATPAKNPDNIKKETEGSKADTDVDKEQEEKPENKPKEERRKPDVKKRGGDMTSQVAKVKADQEHPESFASVVDKIFSDKEVKGDKKVKEDKESKGTMETLTKATTKTKTKTNTTQNQTRPTVTGTQDTKD